MTILQRAMTMTAKRDQSGRIQRSAKATWNFSVDGGAVSTITLSETIPKNAIITRIDYDCLTAVTSGGAATLQLLAGSENIGNQMAYQAFATPTLDEVPSCALAWKVTTQVNLKLTIGTATLTAGKIHFTVSYKLTEANTA